MVVSCIHKGVDELTAAYESLYFCIVGELCDAYYAVCFKLGIAFKLSCDSTEEYDAILV